MFAAQTARLRLQQSRLPLTAYQTRQFGIFDYFKGKKTEEVKVEEEVAAPKDEIAPLKEQKVSNNSKVNIRDIKQEIKSLDRS